MNVLITTVQVPFVRGGAEVLAESLLGALRSAGHVAEIVAIPFKWYPAEIIPEQMLACGLLDVSDFNERRVDKVIGLKFPSYLIPHPRKTLWLLHQHRQAYDLWGTQFGLNTDPMGAQVREVIRRADEKVFTESGDVYTIAGNVSRRLRHFCGVESRPLYNPPAGAELYACGDAADYFFFPSRVDLVKRQSLVIEALAKTRQPVQVRFAGAPTSNSHMNTINSLVERLGVGDRVRWMGSVSEEDKRALYAQCLGVIYPPLDEDYGYVTLEAMLASKPVITCTDAGGPLEFVVPEGTGLVTTPEPASLAEAMDRLWLDRTLAAQMGAAGRSHYMSMGITWEHVVNTLLQ